MSTNHEQGERMAMMKCPVCGSVYNDDKQVYCLNDGTALVAAGNTSEPTVQFGGAHDGQAYRTAPTQNYSAAPQPRKKKTAFWILGGVGVLIVFLFVGVLLAVGLLINYKKTGDPLNSNSAAASPTPVAFNSNSANASSSPVPLASGGGKYEPELKMAINSANNAQSTAYATLDPGILGSYYSGEALKSYVNDVATLKKTKIYQISAMQKQDFEYFKVNEAATEAEVRVTETWETTVYRLGTRNCLLYYPPAPLPQTVYLKKSAGGWMVDSTVYDASAKKEPQTCPKKK